jgi:zinc transporter ZupT
MNPILAFMLLTLAGILPFLVVLALLVELNRKPEKE